MRMVGESPGRPETAQAGLRVVIAEDGLIVREGVAVMLRRFGHEVVAAVGDADELRAAVAEHRPDIVVTDVRMPPDYSDEGLRAAIELRAADPGLPVLVLSQYVAPAYAAELLDAGTQDARKRDTGKRESGEHDATPGAGVGYLLKDRIGDVADFVDALVAVAEGQTVVDQEVVRQLLGRRRDPLSLLTTREREVLGLVAEGRSNTAIARRLVVTEAAVAKHIGSVLTKLDLPPDADDHRRVRAVLAYLRG
ncbi:response regulator [Paractinoplanes rhizophilus]|uniref:Response regulator n=1 Tax=Paractinoplanes rhizophilus TaxID=1416877 RepID=A0ABW2HY98_9ACTN